MMSLHDALREAAAISLTADCYYICGGSRIDGFAQRLLALHHSSALSTEEGEMHFEALQALIPTRALVKTLEKRKVDLDQNFKDKAAHVKKLRDEKSSDLLIAEARCDRKQAKSDLNALEIDRLRAIDAENALLSVAVNTSSPVFKDFQDRTKGAPKPLLKVRQDFYKDVVEEIKEGTTLMLDGGHRKELHVHIGKEREHWVLSGSSNFSTAARTVNLEDCLFFKYGSDTVIRQERTSVQNDLPMDWLKLFAGGKERSLFMYRIAFDIRIKGGSQPFSNYLQGLAMQNVYLDNKWNSSFAKPFEAAHIPQLPNKGILHTKTALFTSSNSCWILTGSGNWTDYAEGNHNDVFHLVKISEAARNEIVTSLCDEVKTLVETDIKDEGEEWAEFDELFFDQ